MTAATNTPTPAAATPAAAAATVPAAATATPATAAAAAPATWVEAKDPSSGKSYWYNRATKETTWKNPNATPAAAPAPPTPAPAAAAAPTPAAAEPAAAASSTPAAAGSAAARLALMKLRDDSDDDESSITPLASSSTAAAGASSSSGASDAPTANIEDLVRDDDSDDDGSSSASDRKKLQEDDSAEGHEFRFAKHRNGIINRVFRTGKIFDESKLLTFKKSLIKKALLKQNRELDEEAVQTFKNIMSYMGDRSSSKPPIEHAKKMLRNLMIAPSGLRDEAYMQICKQTNGNPKQESTIKGWELMSFFLATFPPSKNLKSFLLDHCKKAIDNPSTNPRVLALAKLAVENLPTIIQLGQRKQVPSTVELQCLMESKPIPIKIQLCNGEFKTLSVSPYALIEEVEKMMHERFNITYRVPFALYEQAEVNEERLLDGGERMLDVLAKSEKNTHTHRYAHAYAHAHGLFSRFFLSPQKDSLFLSRFVFVF